MKQNWGRLAITLAILCSFALQCMVAVQAQSSQICLHQLGLISAETPAQHQDEQCTRSCCAPKQTAPPTQIAASCCQGPFNDVNSYDGCDCCVSHKPVPQTSSVYTVQLPELQLNSLCVADLEIP
ncbi:MAG: hypothetical protein R3C11_19990 [Planctomycetaceae bacterium]